MKGALPKNRAPFKFLASRGIISIIMNKNIINFQKYMRAANYLTAAQIFLQENFLLERPLVAADIKPRLLGHWGSGPGINFSYMHLSHMIKKYGQEMMFVLGPVQPFKVLMTIIGKRGATRT